MLGAGASMGSMGGNQRLLPSGPQLRDDIIDKFRIPTDGQTISLSRAYGAAKRSQPHELDVFIRSWFTQCTPDWQLLIPDFDWHRIWTLNIDDIVESAYRRKGLQVDRFNWTARYRDRSSSGTQVIHLHGFADAEPNNSDLVFSIGEYLATLKDPRAWHTVFTDEFAERPFLVLGASLVEEFDLQQALSSSAAETSRGFPSAIVLNSVTELERQELSELGLLVVEAEARTFMKNLHAELQQHRGKLRGMYGDLTPETSRFLQQFTDLRRYEPHPSASTRNFYAGYEPHWRNILDEDDARLESTDSALSSIREEVERPEVRQAVHVLTGYPGAGKSTGLLRIARAFVANGTPVFQFRGEENLDVTAALDWLKRVPGTALIINDLADFADSIEDLAQNCAQSKIGLLVVGSERLSRRNILEHKIDGQFLQLRDSYRLLSDRDIESLTNKLRERRRLGRITGLNPGQRLNYFKRTASRRLFEGMANLEGGQGFQARIKSDIGSIQNESLKRLYAASSIAYEIGYPLPLGVASKLAGLSVRELETLLTDGSQDRMVIDSNGVRPPHRLTASLVVESALTRGNRFDAMRALMLALAPHVDIRAITRGTLPYRLVRRLMDQETVMRLIGPQKGRELYGTMQAAYDWNGRYWDQRALFESELGNHAEARSYAEHSLQLHRHPFALNTLGTVLGRIALEHGDISTLREATKSLEDARDERRWEASDHPYVTFFTTMIRFGEKWGLSVIPTQMRNNFNEWLALAQRSRIFTNANVSQQLQKFQEDWLLLAT